MVQSGLSQFGSIPFGHGELMTLFGHYKSPNDKIYNLLKKGKIIKLKKGLYINGATNRNNPLNEKVIANSLYGPSYLSFDTALSFHGTIPERVTIIQSVTTKRSKCFENPVGYFTYKYAPAAYYFIGVSWFTSGINEAFLMATPEKALCDKIVYTKNLNIRSVKGLAEFLFEDMRYEEENISVFDTDIIRKCSLVGKKQKTLRLLIKLIEKL